MRVLVVIDGMNVGGAESMIMNINRVRNAEDLQFDFFLSQSTNYFEEEIKSYGQFVYISKPKSKHLIKYCQDLKRVISIHNYKIVHIHASKGTAIIPVLVAKFCRVKKIIVHSHNSDGGNKIIQRFFGILLKSTVKYKLACTKSAGQWMYGKNSKFEIIDNPIDVKKFRFEMEIRKKYRSLLSISDNTRVFIHVGRFSKQKNHIQLINIYDNISKKIEDTILILVGNGELLNETKALVSELKLTDKVRFLGIRNDISGIMSSSDVFLLPSLYEGFPLTIIEAQSNGLSCIVSDTVTELIKETDLIKFINNSDLDKWVDESKHCTPLEERTKYNEIIINKYDSRIIYSKLMKIYKGEKI